jgi:hypothetical protein
MMVTFGELYVLGKNYPFISLGIAAFLFIIGFKFAKNILWILAGILAMLGVFLWFI